MNRRNKVTPFPVAGLSEGQNIPEQIEMQVEHEKESKIESVNKTQDKNVIRKESEEKKVIRKESKEEKDKKKDSKTDKNKVKQPKRNYKHRKYFVFLFTLVIWIFSIFLIAGGVWLLFIKDFLKEIVDESGVGVNPAAVILVIGCLVFVIFFVGWLGALRENVAMLKTFCTLLSLLIPTEVTLAIFGFINYQVYVDQLSVMFQTSIRKYQSNEDIGKVVDFIQTYMKCCGIKHADDWNNNEFYNCDRSLNLTNSNKTDGNVILNTGITSNNTLLSNPTSPLTVYCGAPSSCCRSDTDVVITESCGLSAQTARHYENLYDDGCITRLSNWISNNLFVFCGIFAGVAVLQIFLDIFAHTTSNDIKRIKKFLKRIESGDFLPEEYYNKTLVDKSTKYILFATCSFFWMVSLLMIGGSIWAWNEKGLLDGLGFLNFTNFDPIIIIFTLGVVIFLITFFGATGSLRENVVLLRIFYILLGFVIIAEVVIGVLAFLYKEKFIEYFERFMKTAISKYREDPDLQAVIDLVQSYLKCCGAFDITDWDSNIYFLCNSTVQLNGVSYQPAEQCGVPFSCCRTTQSSFEVVNRQCGYGARSPTLPTKTRNELIYIDGCLILFKNWIVSNMTVLAIGGAFLFSCQITPCKMSHDLVKCIEESKLFWKIEEQREIKRLQKLKRQIKEPKEV